MRLQETEDVAKQWVAKQKAEVATMKAGMRIMQLLFQCRKRNLSKELLEKRQEMERLSAEMHQRMWEAERQVEAQRA